MDPYEHLNSFKSWDLTWRIQRHSKKMVRPEALSGAGTEAVSRMTGSAKTEEEKKQISEELEAERKKQLEDQRNMGKLFLAIGAGIVLWGWMNSVVSWHFHYVAQLVGLERFPLPEDLVWARKALTDRILARLGGAKDEL